MLPVKPHEGQPPRYRLMLEDEAALVCGLDCALSAGTPTSAVRAEPRVRASDVWPGGAPPVPMATEALSVGTVSGLRALVETFASKSDGSPSNAHCGRTSCVIPEDALRGIEGVVRRDGTLKGIVEERTLAKGRYVCKGSRAELWHTDLDPNATRARLSRPCIPFVLTVPLDGQFQLGLPDAKAEVHRVRRRGCWDSESTARRARRAR